MRPRLLLAALVLCSGMAAQVTSPRGLDTTEASTVFYHFSGSRRFQQVDFTHAGAPVLITAISWRRNGNVSQTAPPRTMDLSIDLGHTNFGVLSHRLDDNGITNQHRCSYAWNTVPSTAGVATHFIGGGMVLQLR